MPRLRAQENCDIFEDEEENKFDYTTMHIEFRQLVERLLEGFLRETGISHDQFLSVCEVVSEPSYDQVRALVPLASLSLVPCRGERLLPVCPCPRQGPEARASVAAPWAL